jgi:hypothetical protein
MFLGVWNGGFAARLIDKILEGVMKSGKQRTSTVTLAGRTGTVRRLKVCVRTPRYLDRVSPLSFAWKY